MPSSSLGGIKENCNTKIAFMLFNPKDSKLAIDEEGAENLNGCGDMIIKSTLHGENYKNRIQLFIQTLVLLRKSLAKKSNNI